MRKLLFVLGFIAFSSACFAQHPGDTVNAVFADKYGAVWLGTDYGLLRKTDNTWKAYFTKDNEPGFVKSLTPQQSGSDNLLWIGTRKGATKATYTSEGIISRMDYSKGNSGLQSDTVNDIAVGKYMSCFYATPLGLGVLANTVWSFLKTIYDVSNVEFSSVKSMGDTVYIATRGNGVARLVQKVDGTTGASSYVKPWSGLPSDDVTCVFIDSRRNQWYGTAAGLARHTSIKAKEGWDVYLTNELPDPFINAIAEDPDGNIWIGTNGGLSKLASDLVTITTFKVAEGLPDNHINSICVLGNNSIWIGTNKGASYYDGGKFGNILTSDFAKNFEGTFGIEDDYAARNKLYEVYPNPVSSDLNIRFNRILSEPAVVQIFDLRGSLVKNWVAGKNQNEFHRDISRNSDEKLVPGIYLLVVQSSGVKQASKIVVL